MKICVCFFFFNIGKIQKKQVIPAQEYLHLCIFVTGSIAMAQRKDPFVYLSKRQKLAVNVKKSNQF